MEKHYETIIIERSEIESKILGLEKKIYYRSKIFFKEKSKVYLLSRKPVQGEERCRLILIFYRWEGELHVSSKLKLLAFCLCRMSL